MSYVEPTVTASDAQTLASDTVVYLADSLPPARTTLVLDPPAAKDHDALTAAMLPALRARGYGVTLVDPQTGKAGGAGVPLRYIASPLDSGVLLRLQYQGIEASRYYPRSSNGQLLLGAPFTVRGGAQ
ncbi:conjugal transfer protein TrbH [Pseudomonas aeruginosa]